MKQHDFKGWTNLRYIQHDLEDRMQDFFGWLECMGEWMKQFLVKAFLKQFVPNA